jgi:hypothetical protein
LTRPDSSHFWKAAGIVHLAVGLDARRPEDIVQVDVVNGTGWTG